MKEVPATFRQEEGPWISSALLSESWLRSFSIELFADVLKPAWIEEALKDHARQSLRIRKLPSGLVVWLCNHRGSGSGRLRAAPDRL